MVEYDGGRQKQCNFKYEEQVDQMLDCIGRAHPEIKLVSAAAEARAWPGGSRSGPPAKNPS